MQNKALIVSTMGSQCKILVMRAEACGSCEACNACGAKPSTYVIENTLQAKPGEAVMVEMKDADFFRRVGLLYVLPMLLFVGGIVLTDLAQKPLGMHAEALDLIGGLLGIVLYWAVIRKVDRKEPDTPAMRMLYRTTLEETSSNCCEVQH